MIHIGFHEDSHQLTCIALVCLLLDSWAKAEATTGFVVLLECLLEFLFCLNPLWLISSHY